jgi:hypothetical protein
LPKIRKKIYFSSIFDYFSGDIKKNGNCLAGYYRQQLVGTIKPKIFRVFCLLFVDISLQVKVRCTHRLYFAKNLYLRLILL